MFKPHEGRYFEGQHSRLLFVTKCSRTTNRYSNCPGKETQLLSQRLQPLQPRIPRTITLTPLNPTTLMSGLTPPSHDSSSDRMSVERAREQDQKRFKKRGPDRVTRRPTKETLSEGRKRRVSQRVDKEHVSGEGSETTSGMDTRSGQGLSKRMKTSDRATIRPPE